VLSSPRCREVFQPRADEDHHVFQERNLLVVAEPERELSVGNKVFQRVRVVTFEVDMKLRMEGRYHALTGTYGKRPGLRAALAACRDATRWGSPSSIDHCLARSLADARAIADELTACQVRRELGGSVCDPIDPVGR